MGIIIGPPLVIHAGGGGGKAVQYLDPAEAEYVFRASGGGASIGSGKAKIDKLKGRSLVWNQLVQNGDFSDGLTGWSYDGFASPSVAGGEVTVSVIRADVGGNVNLVSANRTIVGHKYYYSLEYFIPNTNESINRLAVGIRGLLDLADTVNAWTKKSGIKTVSSENNVFISSNPTAAAVGDYYKLRKVQVFDLTLMFGAGNEPATVEEFESLFPLPYYEYNAGEIISNKTEQVKVVGFNQWDEEWQNGYFYDSNGVYKETIGSSPTCILSKNLIQVRPSTTYCYSIGKSGARPEKVAFFDANKDYISMTNSSGTNPRSFTTPENCYYIKFYAETYSPSYLGDICINFSDPSRNGQYEPYKTNTIELNLPTLTGKLNGEGESVVVFPDGLKSAGTVYDEIVGNKAIKRIGVVDLGNIYWNFSGDYFTSTIDVISPRPNTINGNGICAIYAVKTLQSLTIVDDKTIGLGGAIYIRDTAYSDAATFKTAMSGVLLYYELETPQEYILDTPLPKKYKVWSGGTEERLPKDTSSVVNAPVRYDVLYPEPKD